ATKIGKLFNALGGSKGVTLPIPL
ncbi:hypothetical protein CCACVL1_18304, partial [Corchorus capsularis]